MLPLPAFDAVRHGALVGRRTSHRIDKAFVIARETAQASVRAYQSHQSSDMVSRYSTRIALMVGTLRARLSRRGRPPSEAERMSWIRAGTEVMGSVTAADGNAVLVEGLLNGDILGAGVVYVAALGRVRGFIEAKEVVVAGEIHGDVKVQSRCEVHATGLVVGSVNASTCLFLEGARVIGALKIGQVDDYAPAPVPSTAPALVARGNEKPKAGRAYRLELDP